MASHPWLKVNADGERFINESGTYENPLHADEYNKGHCHYTIFDSNWMEYSKQFKMQGCARIWPFANGAQNVHKAAQLRDVAIPKLVSRACAQADTIEELAKSSAPR